MAIITITKGSLHYGQTVAETVAKELGIPCFSRERLRHEAAEQFGLPEIKFVKNVENPPSILDRITGGKSRYVAYLRSAFLQHMQEDQLVYHGYLGQFFLRDIPSILKVLVTASEALRIKQLQRREDVSDKAARERLKQIDESRAQWCRHLYGANPWDPTHYDKAYHIDQLTVDDVVRDIVETSRLPAYQIGDDAKGMLANMALSSQVEVRLMTDFPRLDVQHVHVEGDTVRLSGYVESPKEIDAVNQAVRSIPGVRDLQSDLQIRPVGVGA